MLFVKILIPYVIKKPPKQAWVLNTPQGGINTSFAGQSAEVSN